ncbi:MAG: hypothetical protein WAO78_09330 [Roseovarius sp.]|jgi:hypothetical protein
MFKMIFAIVASALVGFLFAVISSSVSNSGCGEMGYVDQHGHCTYE